MNEKSLFILGFIISIAILYPRRKRMGWMYFLMASITLPILFLVVMYCLGIVLWAICGDN